MTFLNVGQGDAILIRSPEGQTALIDTGPGVDLVSMLRAHGVEQLDLVVISHPHADHLGGMWQILQAIPVRYYMDNGQPYTTATYSGVMQQLRAHEEITYLEAIPRTLSLGSVTLRVLPLPAHVGSNLNDHSVGLVLEFGEFRGFLSGDSERSELSHFLQAGVVPDATVLKAPHHGSSSGFTEAFLEASRPEVVVVSVGRENTYGHPDARALAAYARHADQVLRTDVHGGVTVEGSRDGSYKVILGGADADSKGATAGERVLLSGVEAALAEPATTASVARISIAVVADAPGNDHQNLNGEYAVLSNGSDSPIDLSGWRLCDLARHCYVFPSGSGLAPGGRLVLHTGRGGDDEARLFWGASSAIWNNDGDTATLFDRNGRVIAQHAY